MANPQMTTLEADGWMIDDGELAHAENPVHFWIPPLTDRQSLEPGSIAKIRFYIRAPMSLAISKITGSACGFKS